MATPQPDSIGKSCFAIMPIADADGYPQGHFKHVYDDIVAPACALAGYRAVRADEVKASNLIHLDILKKLIEAPVAICDLSTRNPNVLFELGIRQAFDKPVVLLQEKGTPRIFDIAPLRYLEYSKEMRYHEVLKTQEELSEAIVATVAADSEAGNVNSIVKLLALDSAARIPELKDGKEFFAIELMQAEVRELRKMVEISLHEGRRPVRRASFATIEFERMTSALDKINVLMSGQN
ncbi:MAG: hypothetical protein ACN6QT_24150 [Burkholderia contaminans]|uniref:Nucleoside 2-deoxyribosyltransferase n=1 Tax=Burkholderia contaminans TaxID=488447 RepID=A0AAP4VNH2_9BURK|nr:MULTISPECIES: hypothetical protein [Burkholderia]MBM6430382.1 hypothetical protein [Burkholderia contaminans]MCA7880205.1 hypothetical protein [Burkholderia contaminans]MDN7568966.1 hypothetical protein [Burkholderia contaminans]MDN8025004.1 hypothetical protein [Burkholderia contaminans]UXZ66329.1 hypothetical protein NUJ29_13970 [Burkholderia contaminans]